MGISSVLGKIFGTEEAMKEAVKAARDGLDALVYTDEEKEQDAAKDRAEARAMIVNWIERSQGQNLARRLIALSITGVWLFQYVFAWITMTLGIFTPEYYQLRLNAAGALTTAHAESMTGAVMLILSFYFAAPYMGQVVNKAMEKFGK